MVNCYLFFALTQEAPYGIASDRHLHRHFQLVGYFLAGDTKLHSQLREMAV